MTVRQILRERSVRAGLITVLLLVAIGFVRHGDQEGLAPKSFWALKCAVRNRADIVLIGDSRTLKGLSPEAMAAELPGARIFNFAFEALNFTPAYLAHAREVIADDTAAPTIVIGVTAMSLTINPAEDGYTSYMNMHRVWLDPHFGRLRNFFLPVTTREIVNTMSPAARINRYSHYHPDGWMETAYKPPSREGLQIYPGIFTPGRRGPVGRANEKTLLDAVRRWTDQGIEVYAFTPPLASEIQAVVDGVDGWTPQDMVESLKSAGANWIDPGPYPYRSYDGVHLDPESARHLSGHIAQTISELRASRAEGHPNRLP